MRINFQWQKWTHGILHIDRIIHEGLEPSDLTGYYWVEQLWAMIAWCNGEYQ